MITITRNKNFSNWFDISFFGRILDQVTSEEKALRLATKIQRKQAPNAQIKVITNEN
jgi:hypothetical protein